MKCYKYLFVLITRNCNKSSCGLSRTLRFYVIRLIYFSVYM